MPDVLNSNKIYKEASDGENIQSNPNALPRTQAFFKLSRVQTFGFQEYLKYCYFKAQFDSVQPMFSEYLYYDGCEVYELTKSMKAETIVTFN